jgi:hypothetical protein
MNDLMPSVLVHDKLFCRAHFIRHTREADNSFAGGKSV